MKNTTNFVYHINSKQLKNDKLIECFQKYKDGDMEARSTIISSNINLIYSIINKHFYSTNYELEDLVSAGLFGLIEATDAFDLQRNLKFSTLASKCIYNSIFRYIRSCNTVKRKALVLNFDDIVYQDYKNNSIKLEDLIGTDENIVTDEVKKNIYLNLLYEEIDKLDERDKQIITLYYGLCGNNKLTPKNISQNFNISYSKIYKDINRITNNLRDSLLNQNNNQNKKVLTKKYKD